MPWLLLALAVLAIWVAVSYNGLVRLRTGLDEAWFSMDVFLKKRYDLIPNLVETVKGSMAHEAGLLERLVKARQEAVSSKSHEAVVANNQAISGTVREVFALAEGYPDLKASASFVSLQEALSAVESDIANARLYYNGTCRKYNEGIRSFPAVFVARMMGYQDSPYWNAEESEREPVSVRF
jgi:LemA protein